MPEIKPMEGNHAIAEAMRQINPDVVAAYPITPSTEVVQTFSTFVANGLVDTNFVAVESEHSAMSACTAASVAGGRVMNATSSQGLALMWEILFITSSLRAPVILTVVNRALSGNINIHCDHSDSYGARDCGWIQIFGENVQEGYDNLIQATRIGEDLGVRLPVMNCIDGFFVSHSYEVLQVEDDAAVKAFVGPYPAVNPLLDLHKPISVGPLDLQDYYFEHKHSQLDAYAPALETITKVGKEFGAAFGREYGLLEEFMLEDAEYAVVALGSACGVAKDAVEALRADGVKAGLLKIRAYRPFPAAEIAAALAGKKAIAIFDRAASYGAAVHPLYSEVTSALYSAGQLVPAVDILYGLGGREITPDQFVQVFGELPAVAAAGQPAQPVKYLGVRE
ncbi:MAG TPA: pyruvate ferredoxin oxidoreductase [Armatimonadota bacterium]|jgi:pyruvate ferredoxin oxidoreductase alpha subunit